MPDPIPLDLSQPAQPPAWVLRGMLARTLVTVVSGRRGSLKGMLGMGLLAAIDRGDATYLGHELTAQRALVIDEENPTQHAHSRLRAQGVHGSERVRYYSNTGARIGSTETAEWLERELSEFCPDVLIVDGLIPATTLVDANNAGAATAVQRELHALAREYDLALQVDHHERKSGGSQDDATLGSAMLNNLADIHLATKIVDKQREAIDSVTKLRTAAKLSWLRERDDVEADPILLVANGSKHPETDALLALEITAEPFQGQGALQATEDLDMLTGQFGLGAEVAPGDLARALGSDTNSQRWRKVRREGHKAGQLQSIVGSKNLRIASANGGQA
jgi:hypothetical protein